MRISKDNLLVYAAKHYTNHICLTEEEFREDLQRYKLARRLAKKISKGSSENIRLLCNHVMCMANTFELKAAKEILLFDAKQEEQEVIKTVLNYLGFITQYEYKDIRFSLEAAKALKEMDR